MSYFRSLNNNYLQIGQPLKFKGTPPKFRGQVPMTKISKDDIQESTDLMQ